MRSTNSSRSEKPHLLAAIVLVGLAFQTAFADSISVNFYHTGATLAPDSWAGSVRVPGWNNVRVPGGFGTSTGQPGFGPVALLDLDGDPAAELVSTLQSYYNGNSGSTQGTDGLLMAEYVSWDPPGDGVGPDDTGNMRIRGLGETFTAAGYDVILYADADRNDRTFTVTVGGESIIGSDFSTFDGTYRTARGAGIDANTFIFEDLTSESFTIDVASNTGRAAVNALQIIPNGFEPPIEPPPPPPPPPADGPNIVLFLVDDMGWQDTSLPFHDERTVWNDLYRTPNMERLASRGMMFTHAYAASPVCSPTRVCLLTGKNPVRTGVTDWVGHGTSTNSLLESATWQRSGLQPGSGHDTLPALMSAAGYRTAHVGKAHFGEGAGADPVNLGFNINIAGSGIGSPRGSGARGRYFGPFGAQHPGLGAYGEGAYLNDALTAEALRIIESAHDDGYPLLLHMAHYAVHTPLGGQGDPALLPAYADRPNPEDDYAALLESMDKSLGAIIDRIEEMNDTRGTLVIFFSDNGGLANHARASTSNPAEPWKKDRHNTPLRSGKGASYEGGLRVPMIVAWVGQEPGMPPIHPELPIVPGSRSDVPVHAQDYLPTVMSIAGIEDREQHIDAVDGRDLSPLLGAPGEFESDRALYWHYPHQWVGDLNVGPGIEPFTAIRRGDWKALYFYSNRRWELYDLAHDIGESVNRAGEFPEMVTMLGGELIHWLEETGATLPRVRREFRLVIDGTVYRGGNIATVDGELRLAIGDEMPVIVPRLDPPEQQLPSDCNLDGSLDLSDGVCILGHLFRGTPERLPCGDGTVTDPAAIALLDANGDAAINLSDAVYLFSFLFGGGPGPISGTECVVIEGCPASPQCD